MISWSDRYNPFNSDKVLIWREWLEGCAKENFLPPVTLCVDPSSQCGLHCIWCNSADYNRDTHSLLPESHLFKIANFAMSWGVKSVHIFGGGEPLINPATMPFLLRLGDMGLEAGLITSGVFLNDDIISAILYACRWMGVSLDAGTNETFMKVKGTDNPQLFDKVLNGIRTLCDQKVRRSSRCSVCIKFLLHPWNVKDVYTAAEIAKRLGADDFQVRPAGWENVLNKDICQFDFTPLLDEINEQMEKAQSLESESFHVYGVWHKFSSVMGRKRAYSRCWASPLILLLGADGNAYICGDRRGQEQFVLCRHYPDIEEVRRRWNTGHHKQIIQSVKLDECPRCVMGPYHEIVEKVFIKDQMCRNFP